MGCCRKDGRPPCFFNSCLCLSLRSAAIIIAIFDLLFCLGFIVVLATIFSWFFNMYGRRSVLTVLLQFCVHICMPCVLLHGVRTEQCGLLWAWIWARAVELFTDVSRILVIFFPIDLEHYLLMFAPVACYIPFILVIRSLALQMKAKSSFRPPAVRYDRDGEEVSA